MTKFQKLIIAITLLFGLIILYFWRSDVEYERVVDRAGSLKKLDKLFK